MGSDYNSGWGKPIPVEYLKAPVFPGQAGLRARVESLCTYLPPEQQRFINEKVFPFACYWHQDQVRRDGKPYIVHPVAVAEILAPYEVDVATLAGAILHDVYEDNRDKLSLDEIGYYFGRDVEILVDGLTKIGLASARSRRKIAEIMEMAGPRLQDTIVGLTLPEIMAADSSKVSSTMSQEEAGKLAEFEAQKAKIADKNATLAKLLKSMADDPRVILIKLADRLDNMRTLGNLRPEKQKRIARETLNFFCPIADRFGLGAMKKELEERCFHHLNCGVYEGLEKRINVIRDRRRQDGESLCATIEQKLKEAGLEAYVQIEKDGVYSVFRRIQRLNIKSTESIHDLNSVEALTNLDPVKAVPDLDSVEAILDLDSIVVVVSGDTTDCFSAERALSSYSHWNYENYINTPKANRYQAIHFTISSEGKNCWRIRICSEDGYKLNKDGVFTEFKALKGEGWSEDTSQAIADKWAPWIESLRNLHDVASDDADFLDLALDGPLAQHIICYTSRGDAVELPVGSVPLDFAFAADPDNPDLGLHCGGAVVGGRSVSCLDYELKDNDFVQIITDEKVIPLRSWYDACRSPKARSRLSECYSKMYSSESNQGYGLKLLTSALIKEGWAGQQNNPEFLEKLAAACHQASVQDMLASLGTRSLNMKSVSEHFEECAKEIDSSVPESGAKVGIDISPLVYVSGCDSVPMSACTECLPVIGDQVIAIGDGSGHMILHREGCGAANRYLHGLAEADKGENVTRGASSADSEVFSPDDSDANVVVKELSVNESVPSQRLVPSSVGAGEVRVYEGVEWLPHADAADFGLCGRINVKAINNFTLTRDIMLCCRDLGHKIRSYQLENDFESGSSSVSVVVEVVRVDELEELMEKLRRQDGIVEVAR